MKNCPRRTPAHFLSTNGRKTLRRMRKINLITLDQLFDRYEELSLKSLGDKTEEGQELRALIRSYIEQEKLPIRVTRFHLYGDLLDMIEETIHKAGEQEPEDASASEPEEPEAAAPRRRR